MPVRACRTCSGPLAIDRAVASAHSPGHAAPGPRRSPQLPSSEPADAAVRAEAGSLELVTPQAGVRPASRQQLRVRGARQYRSLTGGVRTGVAGTHGFASHSFGRPWEYVVDGLGSPIEPSVLRRVGDLRVQGWQLAFALFNRGIWLFRRLRDRN
jgi:hypothetical protein